MKNALRPMHEFYLKTILAALFVSSNLYAKQPDFSLRAQVQDCRQFLNRLYPEANLEFIGRGGEGIVFRNRSAPFIVYKVYRNKVALRDALRVFEILGRVRDPELLKVLRFISPQRGVSDSVMTYEDVPGTVLSRIYKKQPEILRLFDDAIDRLYKAFGEKEQDWIPPVKNIEERYANRFFFFSSAGRSRRTENGAISFHLKNFKFSNDTGLFYMFDSK